MNSVTTRMQKTTILAVVRHKRPSIFGKLIPEKFREQDSNLYANQASRMRLKIGTVGASVISVAGFSFLDSHSFLQVMTLSSGMVAAGVTGFYTLMTSGIEPTRSISDDIDPRSLSMLAREAIHMSQEGLSDRDRTRIHRLVQDASRQVEDQLGRQAWSFSIGMNHHAEASMAQQGVFLSDMLDRIDLSSKPGGVEEELLTRIIAQATPHIRAICEGFGVDPAGFAEPTTILPGMRRKAVEALPDLDRTTRALAEEWMTGDREGVDPLLRLNADNAAGVELESLTRAWDRARASASIDNLERVDDDMRLGCRRICATLSEAIMARGRHDRDALTTQRRYLESKHEAHDHLEGIAA
jgi:hypothetical protein